MEAEDWSDPAKIAKAFQIGKLESEASSNLLEKVSPTVTEALTDAVRERGMRSFLLHETLAKNLFNQGWSSNADGWTEECTNLSDNKLVDRLRKDLFFVGFMLMPKAPTLMKTCGCCHVFVLRL